MMNLIVDTNVLVGELLRERGRELILNSNLRLYATERVIDETRYELERRLNAIANQNKISETEKMFLLELTIATVETKIVVVPEALYVHLEAEARERIPADTDDWPTVALAMKLQIAIWTQDHDFLGCGCPTWTTQSLISHLRRYGLM